MHLPTHALASWMIAEARPLSRRQRALLLVAGLVPDVDALSLAFGVEAYQRWHHTLLHNGLSAVALSLGLAVLSVRFPTMPEKERGAGFAEVLLLCLAAMHLHFLCDVAGSGSPDGSLWPVPYLLPFSSRELNWSGQWGLASWQNVSITVGLLLASVQLTRRRGRTLLEAVLLRADAAVVEVVRRRWPLEPGSDTPKLTPGARPLK
jgi:hypothetical protein